ncbi:hypothetical protein V1460_23950 [Streptomyces sp. SCSIO 30461]|uniref:hypothetical protein n=1 Tax=Streptomyces sp. SCSIO 30461 TaxID=3118085 RepID=UPI0030CB6E1D
MTTPAASTTLTTATGGERRPPRADCLADSTGTVTFTWEGSTADGDALVLRRRGAGTGPDGIVRLPLTERGSGRVGAVLSGAVDLAEGQWDAFTGDGTAVAAGIRDLRAFIDRVPEPGPVAVRLPYPEADGRLAVRAWVREPHAEAGDIEVGPGAFTVAGVLYGARLGAGAKVEARLGDKVRGFAVTGEAEYFRCTVRYADLVGDTEAADAAGVETTVGQQLWTLWLHPAAESARKVRISRLLDDIWNRKDIYVYPAHQSAGYRAVPGYTGANDLCVRLMPLV